MADELHATLDYRALTTFLSPRPACRTFDSNPPSRDARRRADHGRGSGQGRDQRVRHENAAVHGTTAFKKIYVVDLDRSDTDGYLVKEEVADLLHIHDPDNLAGHGPVFRFPFQTIESVVALSQVELGILNDNNYPFSSGRQPGERIPTSSSSSG